MRKFEINPLSWNYFGLRSFEINYSRWEICEIALADGALRNQFLQSAKAEINSFDGFSLRAFQPSFCAVRNRFSQPAYVDINFTLHKWKLISQNWACARKSNLANENWFGFRKLWSIACLDLVALLNQLHRRRKLNTQCTVRHIARAKLGRPAIAQDVGINSCKACENRFQLSQPAKIDLSFASRDNWCIEVRFSRLPSLRVCLINSCTLHKQFLQAA